MAQLEATETFFSRQRSDGSFFEATYKAFHIQKQNGIKRTAFSRKVQNSRDCSDSESVKAVKSLKHGEVGSPFSLQGWKTEDENQNLGKFIGRFFKSARRQNNVESPVSYDFIRSPEFKPGHFYVLSRPMTNYNYRAERIDRCVTSYTYIKPNGQLCKNDSKRKIFCEVLGDKVCLDCNGRNVRGNFNRKMEVIYPQLNYEANKRPYGYCPRTIRLTEPLATRKQLTDRPITVRTVASAPHFLNFKSSSSTLSSGKYKQVEKTEDEEMIKVVIRTRPETT